MLQKIYSAVGIILLIASAIVGAYTICYYGCLLIFKTTWKIAEKVKAKKED